MGILNKIADGRLHAAWALSAVVVGFSLTACRDDKPAPPPPPPPKIQQNWPHDMPQVIAYRGGVGYALEESVDGVKNLIEKVGVSVVHIPVVLTSDGVAVAWSDTKILDSKCAPAPDPGNDNPNAPKPAPEAIGQYIHNLTYAQIQGLVCDKPDPAYPNQDPAQNSKISKLEDLLAIGAGYQEWTDHLWFDVELVTDPVVKSNTASSEQYVAAVFKAAANAKFTNLIISSYDWRNLPLVHNGFQNGTEHINGQPIIPVVALARPDTFYAGSPWLADIKLEDVHGDLLEAAGKLGADGVGPEYLASPGLPQVGGGERPADQGQPLLVTKELLARAHGMGLKVFPRVINDRNVTDQQLRVCMKDGQPHLDQCVDGIVTAYPKQLDEVLSNLGGNRPPVLRPR